MKQLLILLCLGSILFSCQDPPQEIIVPDNNPTPYDGVPTIKVENYINRLYIDLLGREPLDQEMARDLASLRAGDLSKEARLALVEKIQMDETGGTDSYKYIYFERLYGQQKARLLEGASDEYLFGEIARFRAEFIKDSLEGNIAGMAEWQARMDPLQKVLDSHIEHRNGLISINEMVARMLNNQVYDQINMNTINFIMASFDNLFFRFPTQAEFDQSFPIIENNQSNIVFGQAASNKTEYISILTNSREFHEGMIRWAYITLMAREPSTEETIAELDIYFEGKDFQLVQRNILIKDEYANF
ncbi:MAG: hypothetical protein AAF927_15735 [Bacteroidota bacterium]